MKKTIKWLIITGIILSLIKLYCFPIYGGAVPEDIQEAKRTGAFLWEYEISRIDTIDFMYKFPIFTNIWVTKSCKFERNKWGIIHSMVDSSSGTYIRFDVQGKDSLFDKENRGYDWCLDDDRAEALGISTIVLNKEQPYKFSDTVHYTIYRRLESYSWATENLIPIFKIELIPK